jgi:hypothetical protein
VQHPLDDREIAVWAMLLAEGDVDVDAHLRPGVDDRDFGDEIGDHYAIDVAPWIAVTHTYETNAGC